MNPKDLLIKIREGATTTKRKGGYKQGLFTPKFPEKYIGDPTKIMYMSKWELRFNQFLDSNINILAWAAEEIAIPYIKPTTGKVHKYFPDYYVKYKAADGRIVETLIEVKPKAQTKRSRSKNPKRRIVEDVTYAINVAKWKAASNFCSKYGWEFKIVTETELFK